MTTLIDQFGVSNTKNDKATPAKATIPKMPLAESSFGPAR
jgi:hypothetical protein